MTLVADTGLFLLLSQVSHGNTRFMRRLWRQASYLRFELTMSIFVWMECASHVSRARPSLPLRAWEHSHELTFLRKFPESLGIEHPDPAELVSAALNLRRVADPDAGPRRGPSFIDAMTAQLVRRVDADVLITDDRSDFQLLLPDFRGEIWTPRELVNALRD